MSTHSLDASGSRPLTTTMNDPARTAATVMAKQGDDAVIQLGGFTYVETLLGDAPGLVEVVTRKATIRKNKLDDQGNPARDADRNLVYEDVEVERRFLRFTGGIQLVAVTEQNNDGYLNTPHTHTRIVDLAKDKTRPYYLDGEITSIEKLDVGYGTEPPVT